MGLTEQEQQKIWILSQKVLYESPEFDKLLSNMQILSNVYSNNIEDNEEIYKQIMSMLERIRNFRSHKIIRKQKVIQELKIDIDDLVSDMVKTIDPKIMLEFNIYEPNVWYYGKYGKYI